MSDSPSTFTEADFARLLGEAAGHPEPIELTDDERDTPMDDLGYDSLVRLELAARVQRQFGVPMPDDVQRYLSTPRAALVYFADRIGPVTTGGF